MNADKQATVDAALNQKLATSGFRFTPQRQHVYGVLLDWRDHPTAEEVFIRTKRDMPEISMATVYNCLDALVRCGLVKQVNLDRSASRFCPNMHEHCHFYCEDCGGIFDVDLDEQTKAPVPVPSGYQATHYEVSIRGFCPACAEKKK